MSGPMMDDAEPTDDSLEPVTPVKGGGGDAGTTGGYTSGHK